jgi:hypothetical protein
MYGVIKQTCSDVGGGQNLGYIDLNDWMDYNISAPVTGTYKIKFRISGPNTGAKLQVKNSGGTILTSIALPNTGAYSTYVDVLANVNLAAGAQKIRIQSSATPHWNFNWFELASPGTSASSTTNAYSQPFPVINANGTNKPDAPYNVVAKPASMTSVQLTWSQTSAPAYNETGFEVYEATVSGGPYKYKGKTASNATSMSLSNLTSGTTYYYKVRAVNNYAASAVVGPVGTATYADKTVPTTPTSLKVGIITKSSVELLWTASSDNLGVTNYDVYVNGVKMYVFGKVTKGVVYNLLPAKAYSFYLKARDAAGNLSASSNQVSATTLTGTNKQDPSLGTNTKNYSTYINFNIDNPAASPWFNLNRLPYEGQVISNIKNYAGNISGVTLTLVQNFSGYNGGGMNTGNNSGIYPDNVMRSAYYCDKGIVARVQVSGLSVRHSYSFIFFGSRAGTGDRTSVYTINGRSVSLNAANNTTTTVQLDNVVPDQNGTITYTVSLGASALYAYQNSLVIKAYSLDAATTSTQSVTAAPVVAEQPDSIQEVTVVQVAPNPLQGSQVWVRSNLTQAVPELRLSLSDAVGSVLKTWRFTALQQGVWQQPLQLPAGARQPGMYLLHIEGLPAAQSKTLKLLKE